MQVLDSTVLLAVLDRRRNNHLTAHELFSGNAEIAFSHQTIRETLAVATRPLAANGLGIAFTDAWESVMALRKACQISLMEDERWWAAYAELAVLVRPTGRTIYDLGQVASVRCLGPEAILVTDDGGIIARYGKLIAIRKLVD